MDIDRGQVQRYALSHGRVRRQPSPARTAPQRHRGADLERGPHRVLEARLPRRAGPGHRPRRGLQRGAHLPPLVLQEGALPRHPPLGLARHRAGDRRPRRRTARAAPPSMVGAYLDAMLPRPDGRPDPDPRVPRRRPAPHPARPGRSVPRRAGEPRRRGHRRSPARSPDGIDPLLAVLTVGGLAALVASAQEAAQPVHRARRCRRRSGGGRSTSSCSTAWSRGPTATRSRADPPAPPSRPPSSASPPPRPGARRAVRCGPLAVA